jgi:hypothetical protein
VVAEHERAVTEGRSRPLGPSHQGGVGGGGQFAGTGDPAF